MTLRTTPSALQLQLCMTPIPIPVKPFDWTTFLQNAAAVATITGFVLSLGSE